MYCKQRSELSVSLLTTVASEHTYQHVLVLKQALRRGRHLVV